ncbi:MAG: CpsB/CapC family capsule biosynthesis tyrosine phosphatase [Desulfobacterales bacterium]|nr:CpsB/CapC family capsule biosynthesis tyrosine phosphatase [Desulfobacterales bacterium]
MIDIHCHILPGIDDGPSSIEASVEMAKIAATDGIETIVATPHVQEKTPSVSAIESALAALNERLKSEGIPIRVLRGADVPSHLNPADLRHRTINSTRYILIEFPHSHLPASARETLFNLSVHGYRPIITHPERNSSVIRRPETLLNLLSSDVKVQITADSLTGHFGADIAACARFLLKKGVVDFLATDAHSATYRQPVLSDAVRIAGKILGKAKAAQLVTTNPAAVIAGR